MQTWWDENDGHWRSLTDVDDDNHMTDDDDDDDDDDEYTENDDENERKRKRESTDNYFWVTDNWYINNIGSMLQQPDSLHEWVRPKD